VGVDVTMFTDLSVCTFLFQNIRPQERSSKASSGRLRSNTGRQGNGVRYRNMGRSLLPTFDMWKDVAACRKENGVSRLSAILVRELPTLNGESVDEEECVRMER
jgi:hypothetical protein